MFRDWWICLYWLMRMFFVFKFLCRILCFWRYCIFFVIWNMMLIVMMRGKGLCFVFGFGYLLLIIVCRLCFMSFIINSLFFCLVRKVYFIICMIFGCWIVVRIVVFFLNCFLFNFGDLMVFMYIFFFYNLNLVIMFEVFEVMNLM